MTHQLSKTIHGNSCTIHKYFLIQIDTALDLSSGVTLGELLTLLAPDYTPKVKNINSGTIRFTDFLTELFHNSINLKITFRR